MLKRISFTVSSLGTPSYRVDIVLRLEETMKWSALDEDGKRGYLYDLVKFCDDLNLFEDPIIWHFEESDVG